MKRIVLYLACAAVIAVHAQDTGERAFVHALKQCVQKRLPFPDTLYDRIAACAENSSVKSYYIPSSNIRRPLFVAYPTLCAQLPHVALAYLPTPVQQLSFLGDSVGVPRLYIKRDDMTGSSSDNGRPLFGGNKLRKLEFLFGDALFQGATAVMTFGYAGSNHVVATAACAQYLGLPCIAMLQPQLNSTVVRRNLLLMDYYKAIIHYCIDGETRAVGALSTFLQRKSDYGAFPYVIPTGGSCPVGVVGYVNAAFELKEQIEQGLLPEPDRIYVAVGSCGTMAGLLLGVRAAGLKSQIIGVAVEPEQFAHTVHTLYTQTNQLLHDCDASFPLYGITIDDIQILSQHTGTEYGSFTQEGIDAIAALDIAQGIQLDGTYTGKACAGMLADIAGAKNEVILFWNTFYGDDCKDFVNADSYQKLPKALHYYFEHDVQPLDRY